VFTQYTTTAVLPPYPFPPDTVIDEYVKVFLENLQFSGTEAIVAARSRDAPNYFYDWIRDSAIAMIAVQNLYGKNNTNIEPWYNRYHNNVRRQLTTSPNPGFDIRGDVKFYPDGRVFEGPWGRNQNDGPGLRSQVRIDIALYWLSRGARDMVYNEHWVPNGAAPGIKFELNYMKERWTEATVDAWEECNGYHFHTLMSIRKALYKGFILALQFNEVDYALDLLFTAANINDAIPKHFNDPNGTIFPMINCICPIDRQGYDSVVHITNTVNNIEGELIQSVQQWVGWWADRTGCAKNPGADNRCPTINGYLKNMKEVGYSWWIQPQAYHGYSVASLYGLMNWSQANFAIAKEIELPLRSTPIARYPNDIYDGTGTSRGNPWILANFAAAQAFNMAGQFYLNKPSEVVVNDVFVFFPQHVEMWKYFYNLSLSYGYCKPSTCTAWNNMISDLSKGKAIAIPRSKDNAWVALARTLFQLSDDTLNVPFALLGYPYNLSEQIQRDSGAMVGAPYLTWSYSSLLNALIHRKTREQPSK
jgi:hypothetical protein